MSGRLRSIVTAGAIAGVTLILYGTRLGPPPPLSSDEAAFYAHAQSLASSGRDTAGRLAPLFFQTSEETWLQPIPVYSTAAVLAVTSAAEWGSRFSTARIAALSALLIYLIGRRLFRRESLAISCSALLALTPALFGHARIAGDGPYPLPFVLVWLYCLLAFRDRPRTWLLVIAGVALGLGVYSQPGAPITMAFLAVLTVPALRASGHVTARTLAAFAGTQSQMGHFAAGYAKQADVLLHPPAEVNIVGSGDQIAALHQTALLLDTPSRVVQVLDPARDGARLAALSLPIEPSPVAYVCVGTMCSAPVTDPDQLLQAVRQMRSAGPREITLGD